MSLPHLVRPAAQPQAHDQYDLSTRLGQPLPLGIGKQSVLSVGSWPIAVATAADNERLQPLQNRPSPLARLRLLPSQAPPQRRPADPQLLGGAATMATAVGHHLGE